jgi:pimeloyl-ACP methyl ester carboxylesterase
MSTELVCPGCGKPQEGEAAFCLNCGMPLVAAGGEPLEEPLSEAHDRARKIDPRYAEGPLVKVGRGNNQSEAELIQGFLLEEGIPSVLRRSPGFDVPDFLAAGPRDVLVPESGAEAAREALPQAEPESTSAASWRPDPVKLVAAIVVGGAVAAALAYLLQ